MDQEGSDSKSIQARGHRNEGPGIPGDGAACVNSRYGKVSVCVCLAVCRLLPYV